MPDYQHMYAVLFRAMTKAIHILQEAQQQTEELFVSSQDLETIISDFEKLELIDKEE